MSKIIIKSAKLISWQPDCAQKFIDMDKGDALVICSQRQVGKSFTCAQILLYVALNFNKSNSIYVSPTNDSSRKFFYDIKRSIENSPLVTKINESLLIIEFINGSSILFRSAESKLRGNSCRNGGILVVDEAQYVPNDIWPVVLPFCNVDNSKKIFISTPGFKTSIFYDFFKKGLMQEKGYHLIQTKDYDTTMFLSDEQKEEYRNILSPQAFKTEILGEWIDSGNGIFGDFTKVLRSPSDNEMVYAGLDFAVSVGGDDLVLAGFNSKYEMTKLYIDNQTAEPVDRVRKIAEIINQHPELQVLTAESNSMGSTMISLLKQFVRKPQVIKSFTTTNSSKKDIIENLITKINKNEIYLLDNEKLKYEFEIFKLNELKNGNYTYSADTTVRNSHDDIVMATALSANGFNNKNKYYISF